MQLVERHRINQDDPRFAVIDAACFASKNLYNAALYITRQAFIHEQRTITYEDLARDLKTSDEFRALPAKVAQWVLRQVAYAWKCYFAACAAWETDPSKFLGHPKLPKYLDKRGRNLLIYTLQALSIPALRGGHIVPSGLPIEVKTAQFTVQQVRIVPKSTHYIVEVIYERPIVSRDLDFARVVAIDIGVNNLAALTSNQPGFVPLLVNGRPLKALNQWYNKRCTRLRARLPKGQFISRRLEILADKRDRQIMSHLHLASRRIIDMLVQERIGTLIIGKNDGWKQHVRLGKRNNQNFVFIPHARFIQMLRYKAELAGIKVVITEESYTSKCSFLDGETLTYHETYLGQRIKRGIFRSSNGRHLNADINGSYNIIRKVIPNAFGNGIVGTVVHPVRFFLANRPMGLHASA